MFVKPNDGRSVPDPDRGDLLPAEGREVIANQYWYRRQLDGDVVIEPPVEQEPEAEQEPAAEAATQVTASKKGAK
ncbi:MULTISPECIES: DUF2635 domain-containing protein [Aeromonas]|uniref:DUF2635 domain-containing protein n=1 Tax=Aeromonas TaxID=642 RepID=UPI0007606E41|nr:MULTISPECIES: DUF2635 domain-containing protein [Aeromonas]KWR67722.1 hypothetical protein ATO50_00655 [Aeromonas hydrophila]MBQ4675588.1 DUF2635 domain-containing protein [Aeromonas hydrophila]MBW3814653.1 DUF2635 domain-containing protein [Aeromonas hydrophila]MCF7680650.1 DUF2635 domain-containing protein [Aeromonas hydrophila]MCF7693558.1 DUF2635 domain-containing protein [Aeromonas hydrophila]